MDWKEGVKFLKNYSTGFFWGALLVFLNKERIDIQGLVVTIAASIMFVSHLTYLSLKNSK